MNRRQFFFHSMGFMGFSLLPKNAFPFSLFWQKDELTQNSPIARLADRPPSSLDFNGDNIDLPHDILWNTLGFIQKNGGIPNPSEKSDWVVVGGGISGLYGTYCLKDKNVILLEQDPRFGGNSKGEQTSDLRYSLGAAYFCKPEPGSSISNLLIDLGLSQQMRPENPENLKYFFNYQIQQDYWRSHSLEVQDQYQLIEKEIFRIFEEEFPEIPFDSQTGMSLEKLLKLDQKSFQDWLIEFLREHQQTLNPVIGEYFQLYAWSSFGGSIDEISAAQMFNFICSEVEEIYALPGGNSAISQAIFENLKQEIGNSRIRSSSFVLNIEIHGPEVWVTFLDPQGALKTISCQRVLFAAPKFVAERVIPQMSEVQRKAVDQIRYRAYLVANIILQKKVPSPGFDVFCLEGMMPEAPSALNPAQRAWTDICFADWAHFDQSEMSGLTIYKPLPFDGARQFLFNPGSHDKHKDVFLKEFKNYFPILGIQESEVAAVRLTRWGHSIPLAVKGGLSQGIAQAASGNIQGKIFFANQDNYLNPSFESAISSVDEQLQGLI